MWGCFLMSGVKILHFLKDWCKSIPIHQNYTMALKEKLPQAVMQIEWMKNYFRNLTAKVWANLGNPIKSYDFLKFWLIYCMPPSQVALR